MSLLTEEQISEIVSICAYYRDTSGVVIFEKIKQWNEKQPPHQHAELPLDWSVAPKWADRATVSVTWDGIGLTDTIVYSRTKRPDTGDTK